MSTRRILIAAALATLCAAPAFAQGGPTVTLSIHGGTAMVSNGGEFTTVTSGTLVSPGDRVMLPEGSTATLAYGDGCSQLLASTGVHAVPATCVASAANATAAMGQAGTAAGAGTAAAVDLGAVGILAGIAVGGGLLLDNMDEQEYVEPPPVSR